MRLQGRRWGVDEERDHHIRYSRGRSSPWEGEDQAQGMVAVFLLRKVEVYAGDAG